MCQAWHFIHFGLPRPNHSPGKKKIVVFFSIVRLRPRDAKDFPVGLTAVCYKGGVGTLVGLISQLSSISHDCDGGR